MSVFNQFGAGVFIGHLKQGVINAPVMSGSASSESVLFATAGIFAPSVYGGRTSAATLPNGTEVNPEELRVATDNPLSTVTRVDHADGIDYGFNSLGIEYQLGGDGPFYYMMEGGTTNLAIHDMTTWNTRGTCSVVKNVSDFGGLDSFTLSGVGSSGNDCYIYNGSAPSVMSFSFYINKLAATGVLRLSNPNSGGNYLSIDVSQINSGWCWIDCRNHHAVTETGDFFTANSNPNFGWHFLTLNSSLTGSIKLAGLQTEFGSEATSFTSSIRTPDKVITEPNILPSDNPQIRYIDSNGDVITEDAKTSALCSYNGTDTITVRPDTSVNAKLVIG